MAFSMNLQPFWPIQAKLTVNQPGDESEKEADCIADQVMRMPNPKIVNRSGMAQPPIVQRSCPKCKKKARERKEEEELLQMKPVSEAISERSAAQNSSISLPPVVQEVLDSPGQPLNGATREFFEPRFGHDFSRVRIHSDDKAAKSAWTINARAYVVGKNVIFGSGQYAPSDNEGQKLLAHELTHIVQQDIEPIAEQGSLSNQISHSTSQPGRLDRDISGGGTTLSDQLMKERFYDRSNFSGRFDGVVNPRQGMITLSMRLSFELEGPGWLDPSKQTQTQESEQANNAFLERFQREFKEIVERTWSYQYNLRPACPLDRNLSYHAKVDIVPVFSNPHAAVHVFRDTPGGRSNAGEGLSALQESDNQIQEHKWTFRGKERQYFQVPSAHEFGHLMGVDHIHCRGNDANCYGVTPDESLDIMGRGSVVSSRDYEPFLRIGRRYGQDVTPSGMPGCNFWVTSGID